MGEKDPLVGTAGHRWSFNHKGEFTLYKYQLSTACVKCPARHGV